MIASARSWPSVSWSTARANCSAAPERRGPRAVARSRNSREHRLGLGGLERLQLEDPAGDRLDLVLGQHR